MVLGGSGELVDSGDGKLLDDATNELLVEGEKALDREWISAPIRFGVVNP